MTVQELLARMSAQELTDWAAYEKETGPLDAGHRADVLAGVISATVANAMRGTKGKRYRPSDFLPNWGGGPRPAQPWQQQLAIVKQINRATGGTDRRVDR